MKVNGSMAEVSQKIDWEGAESRLCLIQDGEWELSPEDPALRQCKTLTALPSKVRWRYGCPEAKSHKGNSG
jgi:hypothetical protein